jgi:hypothetical protein
MCAFVCAFVRVFLRSCVYLHVHGCARADVRACTLFVHTGDTDCRTYAHVCYKYHTSLNVNIMMYVTV